MSDDVTQIAAQIRKAAAGFQIGSIEVWGMLTARPGDSLYLIDSVKAVDGRLELALKRPSDGAITQVSIFAPAGLVIGADSLVIGSAARVRFGGGLDAELTGGQLELRGSDGSKSHRKLPKNKPALTLG